MATKITKATLDRQWDSAMNYRKNLDWKWFLYDLWVDGKHYARWDVDKEQITTDSQDSSDPKLAINFIASTLRSVANFVSASKPKAEVTPENFTAENVDDSINATKYLDFLHDKLQLADKTRGSVWNALKYSVGYWQVLYNDKEQEIEVNQVDPYDLYWDPDAREPSEASFVILAVKRRIDRLMNDPKYDKKEVEQIKGDNKESSSSMKERFMHLDRRGGRASDTNVDSKTVIVREHWYEQFDEKTGEKKIYIAAVAGGRLIRKPEMTDLTQIPFFRLRADVEPLTMYGPGWVRDLIPLNRQINRLESQLAEYNDLMNRGKWISDKNAGVRVINNENGQIIEKKRGYNVSNVPIAPLSSAIYQQEANMKRYMEEIGAAQDALQGRIPSGAKSGKAITALQQGNANSISGLQMNLEDFLDSVYEYILSLASQKYQFARTISPIKYTSEREFIKIIGEGAENKPEDATVIQKKNIVRVKISSWNTMSPDARKESILELQKVIPDLPPEVILQAYEIGNVSDIIKGIRMNSEQRVANEKDMIQTKATAGQSAGAGADAAIAAIRSIIAGQTPQVQPPVSPEFISYIDSFIQGEGQNLEPEVQQAIQLFRDQIAQG